MQLKPLARKPVLIVAYAPHWDAEFRCIGAGLRAALGTNALRIDHIGSTSIPGLAAKPIVDIQISVSALEPMDSYLTPLLTLGYEWRQDNPELTKRYFREPQGTRRTHIHVRKSGSWHEQYALLFREYIRKHVEDQRLYEATKKELAQKYRDDRSGYTDAKESIFWTIIRRADRWAVVTGWEPPPSDA